MSSRSAGFHWDKDTLSGNVRDIKPKLERSLIAITEFHAPQIEAAAKENAPWTDISANARTGLFATPEHKPGYHAIHLAHRVPYGVFLELANEGRFAIIMPTLRARGKVIMQDVRKLFGRIT